MRLTPELDHRLENVSAVAFAIWRYHVDTVNAAAPDWNFLPAYY